MRGGNAGPVGAQQGAVDIKQVTKPVVEWGCTVCKRECIPVRDESRCMWCVCEGTVWGGRARRVRELSPSTVLRGALH